MQSQRLERAKELARKAETEREREGGVLTSTSQEPKGLKKKQLSLTKTSEEHVVERKKRPAEEGQTCLDYCLKRKYEARLKKATKTYYV